VTANPPESHTTGRSDAAALLALIIVGLGLRLLVSRSIWLDEAISITQAQQPFADMIAGLAAGDVHPPLHHAALWLAVQLFGTGELAVRLPSIIAGTLLIPTLYGAGRDLYDRRVGLVAAALGTVAPIAIWYSQEARMYAMFMLFSLIAIWAQVRVLRKTGRPGAWTVYSVATAAVLWTQYFSVLQVTVQQGAFAVVLWRRRQGGSRWRMGLAWAASTLAVLLLLVPLLPVLQSQIHGYISHSAGPDLPAQAGLGATRRDQLSIYAFIANVIWAIWGYHADTTMAQIVAMWPLGMLMLLVLLGRGYSGTSMLLLSAAVVPALILFAVGFEQRSLFELRYFVGAVPVGLLLMARLASSTDNRGPRRLIVGLVVITLAVGLADQQLNGANPRLYDFRGALALVSAEVRPGDVVVYEPQFIGPVVDYYAAGLHAKPLDDGLRLPSRKHHIFVVGSFLDEPTSAAQVGDALHQLSKRRRKAGEFRRPNVRVWVFR
jgi:uncharacterized membrane protein